MFRASIAPASFALILFGGACASPDEAASQGAQQDRIGDEAAIREQIAAAAAALNKRDFAAFAEVYATDGDAMIAARPRSSGRDAIRRSTEAAWSTAPAARQVSIAVEAIRFLDSDVAIADATARFSEGEPTEDRGTWVMVRRDGNWRVGALRVQAAEQR